MSPAHTYFLKPILGARETKNEPFLLLITLSLINMSLYITVIITQPPTVYIHTSSHQTSIQQKQEPDLILLLVTVKSINSSIFAHFEIICLVTMAVYFNVLWLWWDFLNKCLLKKIIRMQDIHFFT